MDKRKTKVYNDRAPQKEFKEALQNMKVLKNDGTLTIRCNSIMKDLADKNLAKQGFTLSDFFREQMEIATKIKIVK